MAVGGGSFLPFLTMVLVQLGYAGMNILSKLAMDSGMNPLVHVAYRQIFAAIILAPLAFFLERKTRPRMTLPILFEMFLSSIFGATTNQVLYFVGLRNSTATVACALSNLLPAFTFILAVPFGLERVIIKSRPGQAKVLGTIVCVGGAILLSFYHGSPIFGQSSLHWRYAENLQGKGRSSSHANNFILGPFLLITSTISWAVWFIIQARMNDKFAAPYTTSALICFMASIECVIIGLFVKHDIAAWSLLKPPSIRLVSSLYAGVVSTALALCLMSWCIQRKGPLYVSVFSPLLLVIVAVFSWALLDEKLYVGTVVGSLLIVLGLYGVLWGKNREKNAANNAEDGEEVKDLELQFPNANGVVKNMDLQFSELSNGNGVKEELELKFSELSNGNLPATN
ncbi:WAT1-related protein At1g09380 isoform X2 [Diospyros lotus]|nr:WAT1-related protein At1g09380 isoform X2 [Diospyros lotus]